MNKKTHSPSAEISTSYGSRPPSYSKNAGTHLPLQQTAANLSYSPAECNRIRGSDHNLNAKLRMRVRINMQYFANATNQRRYTPTFLSTFPHYCVILRFLFTLFCFLLPMRVGFKFPIKKFTNRFRYPDLEISKARCACCDLYSTMAFFVS
jgi:hypothetical protein